MSFYKTPRNELDPLDNEVLERALDATWDAIKSIGQNFDAESDEELEAALRRELIEIARLNGVSELANDGAEFRQTSVLGSQLA
jgi:hypothetical protein